MGGNQINLFKRIYNTDRYTAYAYNGSWRWGDYVEMLQGGTGDTLTWALTDYSYRNYYLEEVRYGR